MFRGPADALRLKGGCWRWTARQRLRGAAVPPAGTSVPEARRPNSALDVPAQAPARVAGRRAVTVAASAAAGAWPSSRSSPRSTSARPSAHGPARRPRCPMRSNGRASCRAFAESPPADAGVESPAAGASSWTSAPARRGAAGERRAPAAATTQTLRCRSTAAGAGCAGAAGRALDFGQPLPQRPPRRTEPGRGRGHRLRQPGAPSDPSPRRWRGRPSRRPWHARPGRRRARMRACEPSKPLRPTWRRPKPLPSSGAGRGCRIEPARCCRGGRPPEFAAAESRHRATAAPPEASWRRRAADRASSPDDQVKVIGTCASASRCSTSTSTRPTSCRAAWRPSWPSGRWSCTGRCRRARSRWRIRWPAVRPRWASRRCRELARALEHALMHVAAAAAARRSEAGSSSTRPRKSAACCTSSPPAS